MKEAQVTLLRYLPTRVAFSWKMFQYRAQKVRRRMKKGKRV